MSRDLSAEERAALAACEQSAQQVEATAIELVAAGYALFKDEAPMDPILQRAYRLYRRVEAALALPVGGKRLAALRAALIDRDSRHQGAAALRDPEPRARVKREMSGMTQLDILKLVASSARRILKNNASTTPDVLLKEFPNGACSATAELLGRYLFEVLGLGAHYVEASNSGRQSHAWNTVADIIVDITADQFGQDPVIVTTDSPWHRQWQTEAPRLPICSHEQWPMYPFATWGVLLRGMRCKGLQAAGV